FSSSLWTFSTLGWPNKTPELSTFHSTDVLVTGFDIIFFWVARMIMMTLKFMDEVPFKKIYIHGLVRDAEGQKMSKSKGNVLDPIDLIDGIELEDLVSKRTSGLMQPKKEKQIAKSTRKHYPDGIESFGTDALRFTFSSLASTGRDINFDLGRIEGYRNFCNKIWNAARYVLMNTENGNTDNTPIDTPIDTNKIKQSLADRWIISRLQRTEKLVIDAIDQFRLDHASQAIYEFIWNEYCDWYLELSKPILYSDVASEEEKRGTRHTLLKVLEATLRLAHPIMPFITEEIWQQVAPRLGISEQSIMLQSYPTPDDSKIDDVAEGDIEWVKEVIVGIRNIRGEMDIKPGKLLPVYFKNGAKKDQQRLRQHEQFLKSLANLEHIIWLNADEAAPMSATQLVGSMEVLVPMAGLIDIAAESARLAKEIDKFNKEISRAEGKLNNEKFINKAPADVVEKERAKVTEARASKKRLTEQLNKIKTLQE
ncbi:MAG: class I tRNA ligase family protein, partial [Pseudomonadales bacterium]|nr:class I tRNA ligase family protein [Pseudomonadales bacterium]